MISLNFLVIFLVGTINFIFKFLSPHILDSRVYYNVTITITQKYHVTMVTEKSIKT